MDEIDGALGGSEGKGAIDALIQIVRESGTESEPPSETEHELEHVCNGYMKLRP